MMNRGKVRVKWSDVNEAKIVDCKLLVDSYGNPVKRPFVGMPVMLHSPYQLHYKTGQIVKTKFDATDLIYHSVFSSARESLIKHNSEDRIQEDNQDNYSTFENLSGSHHSLLPKSSVDKIDSVMSQNEEAVSLLSISSLIPYQPQDTLESCKNEEYDKSPNLNFARNSSRFLQEQNNTTNNSTLVAVTSELDPKTPKISRIIKKGRNVKGQRKELKDLCKRTKVKMLRNKGLEYESERSGRIIASRRTLKTRCNSEKCARLFNCHAFSDLERMNILAAYYDLEKLEAQRQFILRHIDVSVPKTSGGYYGGESRKKRSIHYFLPKGNGQKKEVCRIMFLNTLNIAERQVRTVINKVTIMGTLEPEKRGGRKQAQREKDERLRLAVEIHLFNLFESLEHKCLSKQNCLPSDWSMRKLYDNYKQSCSSETEVACYSLYYRVFKNLNFKFHT